MMVKYAAPLIYIEDKGYIRQLVIELVNGFVTKVYPLLEEVEDTIWIQESIILSNNVENVHSINTTERLVVSEIEKSLQALQLKAYVYSDTILGKRGDEIQHRQLQ